MSFRRLMAPAAKALFRLSACGSQRRVAPGATLTTG